MTKIIGINGIAGSGKNTVADYICDKYENWKQMAFADTLKDVVATCFSWDKEMIYGNTPEARTKREEVDKFWSKELGIENFTPRMALQLIGTDLFRNKFNEHFWISSLKKKIKESLNHIVITDLRFENEMNMIRAMGGQVVQVVRGELPRWYEEAAEINVHCKEQPYLNAETLYKRSSAIAAVHPSEYALAGIIDPDYVIQNNGTLDDLHKSVDKMMSELYD